MAFTAIFGTMQNTGLALARRTASNQFLRKFEVVVRKLVFRFHQTNHPFRKGSFSTKPSSPFSKIPASEFQHRAKHP